MNGARRSAGVAAVAALVAALLWAGYYFFVLNLSPTTAPAALFTYPLLIGGVAYAAWTVSAGHGAAFLQLWRSPIAWIRVGLIVGMQLSVLASTYLAGAVDTALLALVGDVVMTPILLMVVFGEGRAQARSGSFLLGISLSTAGAALTIVGGTALGGLSGRALVIAPAVPLAIAFYFLVSARASREIPTSAVVGQATLGGGVIGLFLAPLFPGGVGGLGVPSLLALGLVVSLGLTSFFIAPVLYFGAIERVGILLPALLMSAIPVFTIGLGVALSRSLPPTIALVGVPVAVVGALFALRGDHVPWTPQYASAEDSRQDAESSLP